jgi:tRNA(Ile)-lysidine synthase
VTTFDADTLWKVLDAAPGDAAAQRYRVAFSGGLDSTVLLCALAQLRPRLAAGAVAAAHVDHGLHPQARHWAAACAARCGSLGVPLEILHVDARPARGESPEAAARDARYRALRGLLAPGEVLLTAHHADDQLETVLIQLLRGAGVAGLAAMPARVAFGDGLHARPLLGFARSMLREWARAQGIAGWLEDPANDDPRFSRNHLRREVLPALRRHWPAAAAAAARSARHCAEAARLLEELATFDAATCAAGEALNVTAMRGLTAARCSNLVRWQARRLGLPTPDERRLATLLAQLFEAARDAHPEVRWPGVVALRHADWLWLIAEDRLMPPPAPRAWADPRQPLALDQGLGALRLVPTRDGGLRPGALEAAPWRVVCRAGGERLRLPGRAGSRALKKLLQAGGVPPWLRARMPLVEIGGVLAAVAGLWIDEAWWTPPGTQGWRVSWEDCTLPGSAASIVGGHPF